MTNNFKKQDFLRIKKNCMIVTVMVQLRINCSISLHKYYRTTKKSSSCSQSKNFPKGGHFFLFSRSGDTGGQGRQSFATPPPLNFGVPDF